MAWDEGCGKQGFARRLFILRFRTLRLSQEAFAERFGLSLGSLKDVEQARHKPLPAMRVLVESIALNPALVERAAREADRAERP